MCSLLPTPILKLQGEADAAEWHTLARTVSSSFVLPVVFTPNIRMHAYLSTLLFPSWKPSNQQEIKAAATASHLDFSFPANIFIDISNENHSGQPDKAGARDLSRQTSSNHSIFKVCKGLWPILYLLNISGVAWLEISIFNQEQTAGSTQRTDWRTDGTKF